LHVALQGVGLLDAAWQKAHAYAHERRQMRAPRLAGQTSNQSADLIIEHPAMQRILHTQRAWIDGLRVLGYKTGLALDQIKHHPDATQREAAQRWCALLTPVLKAAGTEQGFEGSSQCLQVFGGHGYVSEWGIEQNVRDARIAMIYEGTNEIQAIDLLLRKIVGDGAQGASTLLNELRQSLSKSPLSEQINSMLDVLERVSLLSVQVQQRANGALTLNWIAGDFLRLFALALLGWAWCQIEQTPGSQTDRWQPPLAALQRWVLPEFEMRQQIIEREFGAH
jgi:hypothetical protein